MAWEGYSDDPEPLDEEDPDEQEEMFATAKMCGETPEDWVTASEELRRKYAAWLEQHKLD
jgi:hypothetical protein